MPRDLNVGAYDTGGLLRTTNEGKRGTYAVAAVGVTPATTPTDMVLISGSTTETIRIKSVTVSGLATTAGTMDVSLIKRTTANTGGTATNPTPAQFDSTDAAPTATVSQYSVNPTALGTGVALFTKKLNFGLAGAAGSVTFDFATRNDKALLLRGVAHGLAINFNGGAVPSGGTISYAIEFEEDNS